MHQTHEYTFQDRGEYQFRFLMSVIFYCRPESVIMKNIHLDNIKVVHFSVSKLSR